MELLSILKGEINKVPNIAQRSKEILTHLIGNQSRAEFRSEQFARLQPVLFVPDEVKESVFEEFDPVLCAMDVIETNVSRIFDSILDFDGDDTQFQEMMKKGAEKLIVDLIDELEGGFQNGFDDLLAFFKPNLTQLLKVASEPKQANLVTMFGVPPIMNFINHCQNNANQIRGEKNKQVITGQEQSKDVEMKEETKDEARESLQQRYARVLAEDQETLKKYQSVPNSWAYCSLDLEHSTAITEEEQKLTNQSYKNDRWSNSKPTDVYFHGKLRESLVDSGLFANTAIDNAMKKLEPQSIPQELQAAYFDMLRSAVKARI